MYVLVEKKSIKKRNGKEMNDRQRQEAALCLPPTESRAINCSPGWCRVAAAVAAAAEDIVKINR